MNRLGYLPDPEEGRKQDWAIPPSALRVKALPAFHSNAGLVVEVLDQGSLGSCVANAGFQAVRMAHVRQGHTWAPLGARLMGYYIARAFHGLEDVDSGTHLRTFFWALNKFGFCPETKYPYGYDVSRFAVAPPPTAYRTAYDQRAPTQYWRIWEEGAERVEAVKRVVANGYAVAFGTDVSNDFVSNNLGSGPIEPPSGDIAGGHAMVVEGYTPEGFTILNSWGTEFGQDGRCLFSPDYIAWDGTRDLWVVESSPPYSS